MKEYIQDELIFAGFLNSLLNYYTINSNIEQKVIHCNILFPYCDHYFLT